MQKIAWVFVLSSCPALLLACSSAKVAPLPSPQGSGGARGASPDGGPDVAIVAPPPGLDIPVSPCANKKCTDFPAAPLFDPGVAPDAATMFAAPAQGAGPCIWEPEDRTVFPQKWLRPRIKWTGSPGLHRITIHSERQERDLVAYTNQPFWVMPKEIWANLAAHVVEQDIVVTVRAASGGESTVKFQIAPVTATGSIVFWAVKPEEVGRGLTSPTDVYASELRGFSVGDESTIPVLQSRQVMQSSADEAGIKRPVRCIGCHAALPAPDDGFVAFVDDWPWNLAVAGVKPGIVGATLPGLSPGGLKALNLPWGGMMSFSKPHWNPGKRLVVLASSLQDYMRTWQTDARKPAKLVWYNLDAPPPDMTTGLATPGMQFGEVARQGDPNGAACPTWSHDGVNIVYSSTMGANSDGALQTGATDLYQVPFNDGQGGPAKPLEGAADPAFEEYYPAYSPDDQLVIYTRVPRGQRMYGSAQAELAVVPAKGGKAVRLDANDPPICTGKKSPGINNHWAKWASSAPDSGGRRYYWVLFSSNRADIAPVPRVHPDPANTGENTVQVSQLYVTLLVQEGAQLKTFPSIYLWNQPANSLNTTPIWDNVAIPPIE
jgi:hypothetical protein